MIKMALAAAAAVVVSGQAMAQDRVGIKQGDVLLRVRTIAVVPTGRNGPILPALPTESVDVGHSVVPEIDLTYMATNHIGFELIAATSRHEIATVGPGTKNVGNIITTWVLPPTLTAQYHFNPKAKVRPYVGAGVNLTVFWNAHSTRALEAVAGRTPVQLPTSVGWALQAGTDIDISKKFFVNIDVKYLDVGTRARLFSAGLGLQRVQVDVNPVVVGIGLGVRL
ncbi:MAG: outer membrane beta-barrel protein [Sphingomonas sp.]|jgi:outer membrane protein|uniref:OmpW/AlkL family protein n=1 Tax=Sphingomonas sp. TaxID=28214 RepID=UPI0025D82D25|nr:OmpW family outer membrane protein [Sphingomonas sp.]MBX9880960.1 outer membrane beta-barrel protein [Sphingomonas sp.]